MKKRNIIAIFILILLIFGCTLPEEGKKKDGDKKKKDDHKSVIITNLGWFIENIDSTFWDTNPPPAHCFYDFFVHYEGNITLNDIEYVRVYTNSNLFWTIPLSLEYYDPIKKIIGGWYRFYLKTDYGCKLPIGSLVAEIKLKNGKVSNFLKIIPAPGSLSTDGYNYVCSLNDEITPPLDSFTVSMVDRAFIEDKTIDYSNQTITIGFSVDDSRIYNGFVFFYDINGNYVGQSRSFKDDNGNLTSIINNATDFYVDTMRNEIKINNSDITFMAGQTFEQISKFIVVLRDGYQYANQGRYTAYDCRSLSAKTSF